MNTLIKRIKKHIENDEILAWDISGIPPGDVEIIILKMDKDMQKKDILSLIPKRKAGKIVTTMRREEIYTDAR